MTEIKNITELVIKGKAKIFTSNEEALKCCSILKKKHKIPNKFTIVTWD